MKKTAWFFALSFVLLVDSRYAHAFCGFYVAKADTKIFNKASQVVLARQNDKTVITMTNDFKGDPKEFAVVIPVPTLIERGQINIGDKKVIDHLDSYTSPRLVEYFDGIKVAYLNSCCHSCLSAVPVPSPLHASRDFAMLMTNAVEWLVDRTAHLPGPSGSVQPEHR